LPTHVAACPGEYKVDFNSTRTSCDDNKELEMTIGTILLIILILALIGVIPSWPHSRSWGYGPSGLLGIVVVVVIILLLMGRI
jgi:hypothetical protein